MSTNYDSRPRAELLGIKDESTTQLPVEELVLPCHLPLTPTFAAKGDGTKPHLVRGGAAYKIYGAETFDVTSKFATHQTDFINLFMGHANPTMVLRLIPPNAKTALLRLSAEVIATSLPDYEREDGRIVYVTDSFGQRVPKTKGRIIGNRVVYHTQLISKDPLPDNLDPSTEFGKATIISDYRDGTIKSSTGESLGFIDADTGNPDGTYTKSKLYPIMDFVVSSPGEHGDNVGLQIKLPTANDVTPLDTNTFYAENTYVPRIGIVERNVAAGWWDGVENKNGLKLIDVSFKPGAREERTRDALYIGDVLLPSYVQDDLNLPDVPPPFSKMHVYEDELEELLLALIEPGADGQVGEASFNDEATTHGRYPVTADKMYVLNFLGGFDELGNPYYSFETSKSGVFGGASISANSTIAASGGDDGLFKDARGAPDVLKNAELYDQMVQRLMLTWETNDYRLMNMLRFPMSAVWDSGFTLETKKALLTPMSLRKDMATFLSTQSVYDYKSEFNSGTGQVEKVFAKMAPNDITTEISLAGTLRTYASAFPESEVHGTPTCRAVIVGQCGKLINSRNRNIVPLTIELANRVSKFMGSASGYWNADEAYDMSGNNFLELVRDVNLSWEKGAVANQAWANGLVYAEDYDMRRKFFPAVRTVYNNDTSTLNSSIVMLAGCTVERFCQENWREVVGNGKWAPGRFLDEIDRRLGEKLVNRFDERFIFEVKSIYTLADEKLGYRWTTRVYMYTPNMKLVGSYTIVSRRLQDYQAEAQ